MNVYEFLHVRTEILLVLLSTVAIGDYLRRRNPRRRDFALLCSALGFPLGISLLKDLFGVRYPLFDLLGALALFSQPYFLFRLLQYYRPQRLWLHVAVLAGMVASWVVLFVYIATYPAITQMIIFGYCVIVDSYCTWEYSRGMQNSGGILRRRLLLITLSSGLFTVAVAGNVASPLLPALAKNIGAVGLAVTALSAILYYLAFIPPRWLRHAWQYEELHDFLVQSNASDKRAIDYAESFEQLAATTRQAVNGLISAIVQRLDGEEESAGAPWQILAATDAPLAAELVQQGQALLQRTWQERKAISVYVPDLPEGEERRQLEKVRARTWLLVPIVASQQNWGVLVVLLQDRALFIDDDLTLLGLFAQQSAIVLENSRLISELQGYSEQLERKVEERTRELSASEAALRELNATLEQRVEQRTLELQHSNSELDQFAYVASHDLKAPLRAINHLTDWIAQDTAELLPRASKEHLDKLKARVQRMETLLDDLLAYSRVGRQRHPAERVDIRALILDVTDIVAPPAGFSVKISGEMPVLRVERIPLETVFRNLIGNAVKHHHNVAGGSVEISAQLQDAFIEFKVKDDGPGIAPEYHQRIFEIFQTLKPRDQVEGSGIGLAVVKKSVESRGGKVCVESAPGAGTAFCFTWPQVLAAASSDD